MRILIVAPVAYPVGSEGYGGIERLTYLISKELAKRGLDVSVAAARGSMLYHRVKHIETGPVNKEGFITQEQVAFNILKPLLPNFDAILDLSHSHWIGRNIPDSKQVSVIWHSPKIMQPPEPQYNVAALSQWQADYYLMYQWKRARVLDVHCLDERYYSLESSSDNRFIFVGKLSPDKGALSAAEMCRDLGMKLDIVGAITPADPQDYVEKVKALCNSDIEYYGEVSYPTLMFMLATAKAVLHPLRPDYEEAHSHKCVDTMGMGCPVISFATGAMPEVVKHGVDGLLVNTVLEFKDAMMDVDRLDRSTIKDRAWRRWGPEAVGDRVIVMLEEVAKGVKW